MSFIEELARSAYQDEYFWELFNQVEQENANNFFGLESSLLDEKQLVDLFRFSDILSRSQDAKLQNLAFKVIALTFESYAGSDTFQFYANAVLTKLGNFPAIEFLRSSSQELGLPLEVIFENTVKRTFQKIPQSNLTFTDTQYKIFERLKNSNHFSFSGPTSLGKSFIINAYIRFLIEEHRGTDNIVVLVPSRALINQTVQKLKVEFSDQENYRFLSHPVVPMLYRSNETNYIFVFTPERLIAYLSKPDNPKLDYLFVDEAHKVVAEKDSRSPLYYHAILQAERKSIKLFFSSPNVKNPEVFLQIFEKSLEEKMHVESAPVAQNRYFLDLISKKSEMFTENDDVVALPVNFDNCDLNYWLKRLGEGQKNIVYCNAKNDTIEYALNFSKGLPDKKSEKIDEVVKVVEEYLHEKYYLIDCLKKGVAFHFGNLPQLIRQKIERLFEDRELDYLFATSTLLEGVNLPAKNIFILSNEIGLSKFQGLDFWNLAGRAGRMTKEMSGNIICLRAKENKWEDGRALEIVRNKNTGEIKPLLIKGQKSFYKNLLASLEDQPFTRQSYSKDEKLVWDHYANLTLIHELKSDDSILRTKFLAMGDGALATLDSIKSEIKVPVAILNSSSMIKAKYQNKIYTNPSVQDMVLPTELSYETIHSFLLKLGDIYNWEEEESGGRNSWYRTKNSLKYYAAIMNSWMHSEPLKRMIGNAISYHVKKGEIWINGRLESFDSKNKRHINALINNLISDIDNTLRFKLKNYFENYYNLLKERLGEKCCGANWADYLEYGTTDYKIIELQNIGVPRHLAQYIVENHFDCLDFDSGSLVEINVDRIINNFDKNSVEYKDFLELYLVC